MIHHIVIGVKDYEASREFYKKVLAPLNYELFAEYGKAAGFGSPPTLGAFWINADQEPSPQMHFGFKANSQAEVDAFYHAALEAGAKSETPPGLCPEYHKDYYGAFVFDLDGYKIEAVHLPGLN